MSSEVSNICPEQLSENTLVNQAHRYNGMTVNTIDEEKRHNPRLQAADKQVYIRLKNGLELDDLKVMGIAVSANRGCSTRHAADATVCSAVRKRVPARLTMQRSNTT